LREPVELAFDLESQLAGVAQDDAREGFGVTHALQHDHDEHCSLAGATLGLAEDVHALDALGDALPLHLRGVFERVLRDRAQEFLLQVHVSEREGLVVV